MLVLYTRYPIVARFAYRASALARAIVYCIQNVPIVLNREKYFCAREACVSAYRLEKGYTNKDIISAASIPSEILGAFLDTFVPHVQCMQILEQEQKGLSSKLYQIARSKIKCFRKLLIIIFNFLRIQQKHFLETFQTDNLCDFERISFLILQI